MIKLILFVLKKEHYMFLEKKNVHLKNPQEILTKAESKTLPELIKEYDEMTE